VRGLKILHRDNHNEQGLIRLIWGARKGIMDKVAEILK
jgi:hypothetical protein